MRLKTTKRIKYLAGFIILFVTETLIALFLHDDFLRPYIGDVLVVIVIYCFIRIFVPERLNLMPLYIFVFAAAVEISQFFNVVELLGLESSQLAKIVLGSTFDIADIICYFVGCVLIVILEIVKLKSKQKTI